MTPARNGDDAKAFFIGIGAPKCGSTWLFDYLAAHPQVAATEVKELHTFAYPRYGNIVSAIAGLPWRKFEGRSWLRTNVRKAYFRADWTRYFDYFATRAGQPGIACTGEFSPSYMALPEAVIDEIYAQMARRALRVVPMLILRDPVDRLYSATKYQYLREEENRYSSTGRDGRRPDFRELVASRVARISPDDLDSYESALRIVSETRMKTDNFVELYENLFNEAAIRRLTSLLGIDYVPAPFDQRIKTTPQEDRIPDEALPAYVAAMSKSYAAAETYFGADYLDAHWPNYRLYRSLK